jgi:hypothetical protein
MLVRLMYASRAREGLDAEESAAILRQSRANNPRQGITGVLCLCPAGPIFIQALEGGREAVNALYNRIVRDPRHHDVTLLRYEDISERRFAGWSMGQVNMARLNPGLVLKYCETATLDPWSVPGEAIEAMFEEMVASAAVMGTA